jgi:ketosteroid isomerase-like protein
LWEEEIGPPTIHPMDREGFQRWLDAYVAAWQSYDGEAIGALFSDDAEYRYHPWDEALRGREEIVSSWLADKDEPGSWTAKYHVYAVDGDRAVGVGTSRYLSEGTVEREFHNVFLCRFDSDSRCRSFTEIYALRQGG